MHGNRCFNWLERMLDHVPPSMPHLAQKPPWRYKIIDHRVRAHPGSFSVFVASTLRFAILSADSSHAAVGNTRSLSVLPSSFTSIFSSRRHRNLWLFYLSVTIQPATHAHDVSPSPPYPWIAPGINLMFRSIFLALPFVAFVHSRTQLKDNGSIPLPPDRLLTNIMIYW